MNEPTMPKPVATPPDNPSQRKHPVFFIGQELDLNGGEYRVSRFTPKMLTLEAMPGTKALTVDDALKHIGQNHIQLLAGMLAVIHDDNIADVRARDELAALGLIVRRDRWNVISPDGISTLVRAQLLVKP